MVGNKSTLVELFHNWLEKSSTTGWKIHPVPLEIFGN